MLVVWRRNPRRSNPRDCVCDVSWGLTEVAEDTVSYFELSVWSVGSEEQSSETVAAASTVGWTKVVEVTGSNSFAVESLEGSDGSGGGILGVCVCNVDWGVDGNHGRYGRKLYQRCQRRSKGEGPVRRLVDDDACVQSSLC